MIIGNSWTELWTSKNPKNPEESWNIALEPPGFRNCQVGKNIKLDFPLEFHFPARTEFQFRFESIARQFGEQHQSRGNILVALEMLRKTLWAATLETCLKRRRISSFWNVQLVDELRAESELASLWSSANSAEKLQVKFSCGLPANFLLFRCRCRICWLNSSTTKSCRFN